LIVNNSQYETTAVKPEQYPVSTLPEITLVGRSNVGKSTIINTLLNRKNLARVGSTPGKTREINFYNIDEKLYFVDLPGYGYAGVSKTKKATWSTVIDTYLSTRMQLKLLIMLVDIRHSPSKDDLLMNDWLANTGKDYIVVATKADKITRSQIPLRVKDIRKSLTLNDNVPIIPFSSETKIGKDEIWMKIDETLGF